MAEKTTAELLSEAKSALHDLMIGKSARVYVDQNGERIEYTAANSARLRAYIAELEARVNPIKTTRPMRIFM